MLLVAPLFNIRRILVVGGFQSSSERLSDIWVYSVVSRQWEDKTSPPVQRSTIFSSRGGHSACCMGSHLWVYGGYGGALYSRKDLEDVCVLDFQTWTWTKVRMHRRWCRCQSGSETSPTYIARPLRRVPPRRQFSRAKSLHVLLMWRCASSLEFGAGSLTF